MTERQAVLVWNGIAAGVPALVVTARCLQDVADAIAFAEEHGLALRLRGPSAGADVTHDERCLTVDLSALDGVRARPLAEGDPPS